MGDGVDVPRGTFWIYPSFFPRINSWGGAVGWPPTDKSVGWRGCVFEQEGVSLKCFSIDMPF
jgi:hypothetical protein